MRHCIRRLGYWWERWGAWRNRFAVIVRYNDNREEDIVVGVRWIRDRGDFFWIKGAEVLLIIAKKDVHCIRQYSGLKAFHGVMKRTLTKAG